MTTIANSRSLKPLDQLSRGGKRLRRLHDEDPEHYEEVLKRKVERERERRRRMREEDPQAWAEYLRRARESKKRHPDNVKHQIARKKERYKTDPEYRNSVLSSKREHFKKGKESNSESYQRQVQMMSAYALLHEHALRIELINRRGGTCERCPCNDIRCLEIHHSNGDPSENRRNDLKKMRDGEIEYVVLCANCHRIQHYEPPKMISLTPRQAELLFQVQWVG